MEIVNIEGKDERDSFLIEYWCWGYECIDERYEKFFLISSDDRSFK